MAERKTTIWADAEGLTAIRNRVAWLAGQQDTLAAKMREVIDELNQVETFRLRLGTTGKTLGSSPVEPILAVQDQDGEPQDLDVPPQPEPERAKELHMDPALTEMVALPSAPVPDHLSERVNPSAQAHAHAHEGVPVPAQANGIGEQLAQAGRSKMAEGLRRLTFKLLLEEIYAKHGHDLGHFVVQQVIGEKKTTEALIAAMNTYLGCFASEEEAGREWAKSKRIDIDDPAECRRALASASFVMRAGDTAFHVFAKAPEDLDRLSREQSWKARAKATVHSRSA